MSERYRAPTALPENSTRYTEAFPSSAKQTLTNKGWSTRQNNNESYEIYAEKRQNSTKFQSRNSELPSK